MMTDDILARAAHLYFVLGLTQKQVADRLGVPRIKAHRLIALARERGIVRIHIDAPTSSKLHLESSLAEKYGLSIVSVTPSDTTDEIPLSQIIGQYAAPAVSPLIQDDMTVAVSWGVTLKALANSIAPAAHKDLKITPLIGSLSRRSSVNLYEAVTVLSQRLGSECYYLASPIFCDTQEAADMIRSQPVIQDVLDMARGATLGLLSVGGENFSSLRNAGNLNDADLSSIRAAGAVGNYCGHFVDAKGNIVDHEINARVIGITPEETLNIPSRILIGGGKHKLEIMSGMLENNWFTGLITDEGTAQILISR